MSEHEQAALRLSSLELRALLDLSYERERQLVEALNGLLYLNENAAIAATKEPDAPAILSKVEALKKRLAEQPTRNHGLFAELCRLQVEITGTRKVNSTLVQTIAQQRLDLEKVNRMLDEHRRGYMETVAERDALIALLNAPEFTERVMSVARASVR